MQTRNEKHYAYVGSRTTKERNARGVGLSVYEIEADHVEWKLIQVVESLTNPSFLAFDQGQEMLYSVHGDCSEISAFRIDPQTGKLTFVNQESTGGKNPVHLCIDPSNRFVVVANHITSSLAVLPLGEDGALGKLSDLVPLSGNLGPHRVEQPFPKPHQVLFDRSGRFIAVPDKGLDQTFVFRLDTASGKLVAIAEATASAQENAGPRHIAFHPSSVFAYVINELNSTVTACRFDAESGMLTPFQVLPSLPDTCVRNSRASEIDITQDGRFVFASNRGFDSVTVYAVEPDSGRLRFVACQPVEGKTPRFIAVGPRGETLFVANEDSDEILDFAIETESGKLELRGTAAKTGSPVCIVFKPAD